MQLTVSTNTIDTSSNSTNSTIITRKSSSGLSTGAICAITIPTIAPLLGVAGAAALCKGGSMPTPVFTPQSLPPPTYVNTSLA